MTPHTNEDIVGVISGIIGYWISKTFTALNVMLFAPMDFMPSISETLHSIIVAILCAIVGFITTRLCHFIFGLIKPHRHEKDI